MRILRLIVRGVKGAHVVGRKRPIHAVGAHHGRPVSVRVAEQKAVEGCRDQLEGTVAHLQERSQPLAADAIDRLGGKRRAQCHVGHERQRRIERRHEGVQANGRRVVRTRGRERCAEHVDRIGQGQRIERTRALVEHGRREMRHAELTRRIRGGAGPDNQADVDHRHFVHLDDPDGQPVRQRLLLDWWEPQAWRRARHRRLRPIGSALCRDRFARHGEAGCEQQGTDRASQACRHGAPSGTTESSTRRSFGSHRRSAAWMSLGASAW